MMYDSSGEPDLNEARNYLHAILGKSFGDSISADSFQKSSHKLEGQSFYVVQILVNEAELAALKWHDIANDCLRIIEEKQASQSEIKNFSETT